MTDLADEKTRDARTKGEEVRNETLNNFIGSLEETLYEAFISTIEPKGKGK